MCWALLLLLIPITTMYTTSAGPKAIILLTEKHFGVKLPLGFHYGGPLFFAHYSFMGLNPHRLKDEYADYWEQNY